MSSALPGSTVCRFEHFESPWFARWNALVDPELRVMIVQQGAQNGHPHYHRKAWEWCAVLAAMDARGLLAVGKSALGFAVGTEPIASLLAAREVDVVATDMPAGRKSVRQWSAAQHAASLEAVYRPRLVDRELFDRHVRFEPLDMKGPLPFAAGRFDMLWSCCAFEHLGTLERGLDFVVRSSRLLKPGGFAFHTTEYTVSSNTTTLDKGDVVFYRRRDLEELDRRLRREGRTLEPVDFFAGTARNDLAFDRAPYYVEADREHVKLEFAGQIITSALIVVHG
ncbi:MAG: methyltransferase domain-containing protein [Candidatus Velthaea sp.]